MNLRHISNLSREFASLRGGGGGGRFGGASGGSGSGKFASFSPSMAPPPLKKQAEVGLCSRSFIVACMSVLYDFVVVAVVVCCCLLLLLLFVVNCCSLVLFLSFFSCCCCFCSCRNNFVVN